MKYLPTNKTCFSNLFQPGNNPYDHKYLGADMPINAAFSKSKIDVKI